MEVNIMDKKKKKKLLIISGSIVGGFVVLLIILMLSIGAIVKAGVGGVLPKITGTPCSMGMCTFNPIMGKVTIRNFIIGNPNGYAHPNAFKMGTLVIDVGLTSLFSDKIVIEEITIDNMEVDFEVKFTGTNLSTIKGNVDKFSKKDAAEEAEKKDDTEEDAEPEAEGEPAGGKRLQIDLFQFVNSNIIMGSAGQTVTVPLADIVIEDIGNSQQGATVGEVSHKVFYALYESIVATATEAGVDMGGAIKKGSNKLIEGVQNLFGGGKKK
jgi:hypothetical protein